MKFFMEVRRMLIVETIAKIRRYYFVEERSIKQISRDLNVSRNTVRKVIRSGNTKHEYSRKSQPLPKLGPYLEYLDEQLEQDWQRPKKKKFTAMRLYDFLRDQGYEGSYDSVQRYVQRWRLEKGKIKTDTFIPLYFPPGDAYQFDWSHEMAVINGEVRKIKVAHFRLCHSRKFFVAAYLRETQEMVMDSHIKAFRYFGGTSKRGIYDNMSTAVISVLKGKEREYSSRFVQMCSHYLVKPVACTPGAGWEKGQVEKQVRDIRNWLFKPTPRFASLEELNQWLHDRCSQICNERKHPVFKEKTIQQVFEEEQPFLIPVTTEFEGYVEKECSVSSTSLIRYDRNHYSVPCKTSGQTVTVRAKAHQIIIVKGGQQIARHQRSFDREKTIYDPWHYLDALQRKPGALRNGAPFQNWQLPSGLKRLQNRLSRLPGGDRQFVDILFAARLHGVNATDKVCRKALSQGIIQSDVILNLLARELEGPPIESVSPPLHLLLKVEPVADCSRYDNLRKGGAGCNAMN
jgi:transposase